MVPLVLGGDQYKMYSNLIYDQITFSGDYGLAAAMAVVLLVVSVVLAQERGWSSRPRPADETALLQVCRMELCRRRRGVGDRGFGLSYAAAPRDRRLLDRRGDASSLPADGVHAVLVRANAGARLTHRPAGRQSAAGRDRSPALRPCGKPCRVRDRPRSTAEVGGVENLFILPIILPSLVVGLALLVFFNLIGITNPWLTLVFGHVAVTLPLVLQTSASVVVAHLIATSKTPPTATWRTPGRRG